MAAPTLKQYSAGQGSVTADNLNTFEQTTTTAASLRNFIGVSGMQVFARGTTAVGDGGAGPFYWNGNLINPVDDGINTIVPSGSTTGAWIRLGFLVLAQTGGPIFAAVSSIAALRGLTNIQSSVGSLVMVEGYYTAGDGGGGTFILSTTAGGVDNGGTYINSNTTGYFYTRLQRSDERMSIRVFGAINDPTGVTLSTTQITNWINWCFANNVAMYIPTGKYNDLAARTTDFGPVSTVGFKITGDGQAVSVINRVGDGRWLWKCSQDGGAQFYGEASDFGITGLCSTSGVLTIGSDNYSDAFNGIALRNMRITNATTNPAGCALLLNQVFDSVFDVTANTSQVNANSDTGVAALRLTQASFNNFSGSYSASGIGVHFATNAQSLTGFSFGNVFSGLDLEVNYVSVRNTAPHSASNTFLGGTYQANGFTLDSVVGSGNSNVIFNPNLDQPLAFGSSGLGYVGWKVRTQRYGVTTPSIPATTVKYTNTTGYDLNIMIINGAVQQVILYGPTGGSLTFNTGTSVTGILTIPLDTEWMISLTYTTGTPTWVFFIR